MFYILAFIFGAAIGSFLNVLIFRYTPQGRLFDGKRLGGRSHCPYCGHVLGALELVPIVSYLVQGGKCRICGHGLSIQYPLVEFLGGAIFAGLPIFLNSFYVKSSVLFAAFALPFWYYCLVGAWIVVFLVWLVMTAIDLRHYVIPNELNLLLVLLGVVIVYIVAGHGDLLFPFRTSFLEQYELLFSPWSNPVVTHLIGLAFGGSLFGILVAVSRGRGMGLGDVKLAVAAGFVLGFPDIVLATMLAFILGGFVSVILVLLRQKTMRDRIPFAPILVLGFVLTVFFGAAIVNGYFRLFSL
ncbi:prepilin peptidase [Patescibacteria group bacterium]|nr:prepilin peptidase [Patescibacteria group bacterium]